MEIKPNTNIDPVSRISADHMKPATAGEMVEKGGPNEPISSGCVVCISFHTQYLAHAVPLYNTFR